MIEAKLQLALRQKQFKHGYVWPTLLLYPGKQFYSDLIERLDCSDEIAFDNMTFAQALAAIGPLPSE